MHLRGFWPRYFCSPKSNKETVPKSVLWKVSCLFLTCPPIILPLKLSSPKNPMEPYVYICPYLKHEFCTWFAKVSQNTPIRIHMNVILSHGIWYSVLLVQHDFLTSPQIYIYCFLNMFWFLKKLETAMKMLFFAYMYIPIECNPRNENICSKSLCIFNFGSTKLLQRGLPVYNVKAWRSNYCTFWSSSVW